MTDQPTKEEPTEEDLINQLREEFAKLTVKDFLAQTLFTLSTLANQKMGIPAAVTATKDLEQAKTAIDAYSKLFECLAPQLKPEENEAFRQILSKMQLDFVSASNTK
jgi:hypothetical protein